MILGLPTLSTAGVIYDADTKYQRLVAWLFVSEKDQDDLNRDDILTLIDIRNRAAGDVYRMAEIIESELGAHLRKHLPGAMVGCKVTQLSGNRGYDLLISGKFDNTGETKTVGVSLDQTGILSNVVKINNNGGV